MSGSDDKPQVPRGHERTVMVTAEELAALTGGAAPPRHPGEERDISSSRHLREGGDPMSDGLPTSGSRLRGDDEGEGGPALDPFAAPPSQDAFAASSTHDPFGPASDHNPFTAAHTDSFAPPADPFGASVRDPFGAEPVADPLFALPIATEWPAAVPDVFAAPEVSVPPQPFVPPPFVPPTSSPPPVIPAYVAQSAPGGGAFVHGTPGGLVGMHLNDLFEIVRFIAQGGMGEVYEGRNLASNEKVAIKVILPQYAADDQFMALFRREASALERIGHDSLVKYRTLAFDRTNRINYLAIEYVAGPSMADVLVGEPADPAMVRRVLKRLATGLGAAHEAGVIHRDLSPDNLLLPDGKIERCKIIDFGIAKDTNPGEKSVVGEAFAGKFGYAAPEIFGKYKRQVGPWTDVYSLALVMIAYAKGSPLDMGVTIVDALEARDTVPDLSSLSPDLAPIFARMLVPDPAERFRSMDEVVAALDAPGTFAHVSPFGASAAAAPAASVAAPAFVRATTAVTAAPVARSRLPLFGGIAVAVLLVAGGGGYALFGGKSADVPIVAATDAPAPTAVAAVPAATGAAISDWPTARPQVLAALNAVACSDLHVDSPPSGGRVRLAGWRSQNSPLPASAGGWTLDGAGVASVAPPSLETCSLITRLRAAAPPGDHTSFGMPGEQAIALATATKGGGGILVDLKVTDRPMGMPRLLLVNIDDHATNPVDRVASADIAQVGRVDAIPFDAKPARNLIVLIANAGGLAAVTADGPPAALTAACAGGGCALTSGWIDVH